MHILFLCVANSARSQLAEALARSFLGDAHRVSSAGSRPAGVSPYAIRVLAENGIDASRQTSKAIADFDLRDVDLVVTLCAEEVCPILPPKTRHLHWPTRDPSGRGDTDEEKLTAFRAARDALDARIREELIPA